MMATLTASLRGIVRLTPTAELRALTVDPESTNGVLLAQPGGGPAATPERFSYDAVLDGAASQADVFAAVFGHGGEVSMLESLFTGLNVSVLMYGATGTGKTYTVVGDAAGDGAGLIPRAADWIFARAAGLQEAGAEVTTTCQLVEVYNEQERDLVAAAALCSPDADVEAAGAAAGAAAAARARGAPAIAATPLKRTCSVPSVATATKPAHPKLSLTAATVPVAETHQVVDLLGRGLQLRVMAATDCNARSSRSHLIFILNVSVTTGTGETRMAKLTLVDLAGSESVAASGAAGERKVEAGMINKSLLALGRVIATLSTADTAHIPYRDSVLTGLLKDALGGNSMTSLVLTAHPGASAYQQTKATLQFGARARQVRSNPRANVIRSASQQTAAMVAVEAELQVVKADRDTSTKLVADMQRVALARWGVDLKQVVLGATMTGDTLVAPETPCWPARLNPDVASEAAGTAPVEQESSTNSGELAPPTIKLPTPAPTDQAACGLAADGGESLEATEAITGAAASPTAGDGIAATLSTAGASAVDDLASAVAEPPALGPADAADLQATIEGLRAALAGATHENLVLREALTAATREKLELEATARAGLLLLASPAASRASMRSPAAVTPAAVARRLSHDMAASPGVEASRVESPPPISHSTGPSDSSPQLLAAAGTDAASGATEAEVGSGPNSAAAGAGTAPIGEAAVAAPEFRQRASMPIQLFRGLGGLSCARRDFENAFTRGTSTTTRNRALVCVYRNLLGRLYDAIAGWSGRDALVAELVDPSVALPTMPATNGDDAYHPRVAAWLVLVRYSPAAVLVATSAKAVENGIADALDKRRAEYAECNSDDERRAVLSRRYDGLDEMYDDGIRALAGKGPELLAEALAKTAERSNKKAGAGASMAARSTETAVSDGAAAAAGAAADAGGKYRHGSVITEMDAEVWVIDDDE